jgi:uncharacterized repeat protein (TIGR03803 family)
MKLSDCTLARLAIGIGAATLFAGCGGSQLPIGAPGALPQSARITQRLAPASSYRLVFRFHGHNGGNPFAALINVNGTLYGTTYAGGTNGYGTVFSITTSGKERVLHSFAGGSDGSEPSAGLIDVTGTLYGTTGCDGRRGCDKAGCGTVFALTP